MENKDITIFCVNDGKSHRVPVGGTLQEISNKYCTYVTDPKTGEKFEVIAALVDNKLKELSYKPMIFHQVEFIGYNHPDGRRTYIRSLCFVLQNAIRELYPDKVLVIDHSLPSGLYCEIREAVKVENGRRLVYFATDEELETVRDKMREIVRKDLPFIKKKLLSTEAQRIFRANHQPAKAELQMSLGTFTCSVYYLDGRADTFHGLLIPSTRFLKVFEIIDFGNGFSHSTLSLQIMLHSIGSI